ncbi:hypothetical protein BDV59DRAFT_86386 [Aspergillus ambiguus]|uniref:uncharacterized protein n=1 Tax=Aspergillus ambiguus TaxID=176160 RepID=UPI003CCE2306
MSLHAPMSIKFGFVPLSKGLRHAVRPCSFLQPLRNHSLRTPSTLTSKSTRRYLRTKRNTNLNSPLVACTWLTGTPHTITPDDVLTSLPPTSRSLVESGNVPVLLVTPSFAEWADTSSDFLETWINRLASGASPHPVHAIIAIVDQLPDTRARAYDKDATETEGLSFIVANVEDIQGKAAAPRRVRSMETEESALAFSFQGGMAGNETPYMHEIGLRLANTIFINGNENTLFGTRWVYDPSSAKYTLDQSVGLSRCVVSSNTKAVHSNLQLPLHPVSQRRRVISSMGNILRQLTKRTDDTSTEAMPASTELERELPRYIEEYNIEDRRVSVWALVETPEQSSATEAADNNLIRRIQAGGKLHRVMSGGGGWGKKQGLLSLDPEIRFLEPTENGEFSSLDRLFSPIDYKDDGLPKLDQQLVGSELSSLGQVAKEGDYIQFFVSVDPCDIQRSGAEISGAEVVTCQFGVVYDAERPLMAANTTLDEKDLAVLPNKFGALSDKAITYLQPVSTASESSTKIDIPGARVELVIE